jgi:IS5 family transposase
MRPKKHKATRSNDLFRARLDQIINLKHELVLLAGKIDWDWIDAEIAPLYSENGRPGIETRFMIGLLLLKHIYGLSDEGVCERWVHDPYFQHFTGEEFFQHVFPHERSDLSHWRKRLGDKLELLLAESLRVAHEAGALRSQDLKRVTVDTTVQPKAITFPTDAKLLHAAIKGLNRLARRHDVRLRQSYSRVAKAAEMMAGRYAHAKQFRRHHRQLRILKGRLGRIIRDIRRKIEGQPELEEAFALPLGRATQIRSHLRPEARRLRHHQARTAPPLRHRAHHRTPQGRGPPRPLLPQRSCRRRRQRRPLQRRTQLPPHPRLAQRFLPPYPDRIHRCNHPPVSPQISFLRMTP